MLCAILAAYLGGSLLVGAIWSGLVSLAKRRAVRQAARKLADEAELYLEVG